jgi:AraC-like DNA-binding protein
VKKDGGSRSGKDNQGIWSGRVFVGIGRALYIGGASDTTPHLHHAIQICVALNGRILLRSGPEATWEEYGGAIIRSDQRHQLDGSGSEVVIAYLEPESEEGRRLGAEHAPIHSIAPAAVAAIRAATATTLSEEVSPEAAIRLFRDILVSLGAGPEQRGHLEERIQQVLPAVRAEPTRRWRVAEMAEAAGLSSRRFREVFASQVGLSCRQYLLWTRLESALRELARGASLTEAALAAGFADAAHLTRTFRRMVGIPPSAIARSVIFMEKPV